MLSGASTRRGNADSMRDYEGSSGCPASPAPPQDEVDEDDIARLEARPEELGWR